MQVMTKPDSDATRFHPTFVLVFASALSSVCVVALIGCSTHASRLVGPRQAFYANDLSQAHAQLDKLAENPKGDETVVQLDLAMVELLRGDAARAERRLLEVRDQWEHLEQKSLAEAAASLVTDDRRRAYSGEDYEKVLVRVFLTLASLMQDGVDAESYTLQTLDKHQQIVARAQEKWGDSVTEGYCSPAIAPYLRGIVREATLHDYDDALAAYRMADTLQPGSAVITADIERVTTGTHSSPGHGVVYVIGLVGRGPYKTETEALATQEALLIADQILSAVGEYSVPPTLAPVKVPQVSSPPMPFEQLGVEVDGRAIATTMPITDLHELALRSYEANMTEVIARSVARRIVKKGAVYTAKDKLQADSSIASLAFDAAGVLWEASESADTRCWGVLPREIQCVRLEIPAGTHQIRLEPIASGSPLASGVLVDVDVVDGRNTYMLSYWPGIESIGDVLISH